MIVTVQKIFKFTVVDIVDKIQQVQLEMFGNANKIGRKKIYHSGTSINNAGSKIFSINKLEDEMIKKILLNYKY